MKKIFVFGLAIMMMSTFAQAGDVYMSGSSRDKIKEEQVDVDFYDSGQFKGCEEIGAFWVPTNLPKGLKEVKDVKKEAAKIGANKALFKEGISVLFYCGAKVGG